LSAEQNVLSRGHKCGTGEAANCCSESQQLHTPISRLVCNVLVAFSYDGLLQLLIITWSPG